MKLQYTFTVDINFDAQRAVDMGPAYTLAFEESVHEFAEELNAWLERHPLIQGARMQKSNPSPIAHHPPP